MENLFTMKSFDASYKTFLHVHDIVILIAIIVGALLGCLLYILYLYRKNHHKTLHLVTLQFPEIEEGNEERYRRKMEAVFQTLHKLLSTQTDKLFLEIYKTHEYITMQIGSNNIRILEQAKVAFSHIDHAQIRTATKDTIETIAPLYAKRISMSKQFYTIAKNTDFFDGIIHFLSSLTNDEQAGMQLVLRGVNKKLSIQEKMNKLIYKGKKEQRQLTELELALLHMYQEKQQENLLKAKVSIVANDRAVLSNMSTLFQSLNFATNSFSSHADSPQSVQERFIAPETVFSTLPLIGGQEGNYLTASEISYLFHPTSVMRGIYAPKQTKTIEATPEFLENSSDSILIGKAEDQDGVIKQIYFPIKNFARHLYIIGKTGRGKSTLLTSLIYTIIDKQTGNLFVFDPHGELLEDIVKTTKNTKNVVYLDSSNKEKVCTINPLFAFGKTDNEKAALREGLLDIIQSETQEQGGAATSGIATLNRIKQIIDIGIEFSDAYYSYLVNQQNLSPEKAEERVFTRQLTLNDLPLLLLKEMNYVDMLQEIFKNQESSASLYVAKLLDGHTKQFMVAEAVQTRLEQLLHPSLKLIYEGNKLSLEEAVKSSKSFLVPISETVFGSRGARALMQTMFFLIWQYKRQTEGIKRKNTYVFIDEFQRGQITAIPEIISEGRKYKLFLGLSNQQLGQLKEQVKDAILGNMGTLISFTVAADEIGAKTLAPYFGSSVSEKDLTMLPPHTAYLKTEGDSHKPVATFSFETIPMQEKRGGESLKIIAKRSLEMYGENILDLKKKLHAKQANPMEFFLGKLLD